MATNVGTAYVDIKARLADDFSRDLNKGIDSTERRLNSLGGTLTKIGAINALAGLAGQAATLTAALLPAAGAVFALPAAAGVAGVAFGALKVITAGLGDAFTAVASGDAKKINEALVGLSPAAREFVVGSEGILTSWKKVQAAIQQNFFQGLIGPVQTLAKSLFPVLQSGLGGIASAFREAAKAGIGTMSTPAFNGGLTSLFQLASTVVRQFSADLTPLIMAFLNVSKASTGFILQFTQWLSSGIAAKATFLSTAAGADAVSNALSKAAGVFTAVWNIGKNLLVTLLAIFHSTDSGSFLQNLEKITGQMATWAQSAKGQEQLRSLFASLDDIFHRFVSVLPTMATALGLVFSGFNSLPGPVKDTVAQFAAWSLAFGPLLRGVAALSVGLKGAITIVGGFGSIVRASFALAAAGAESNFVITSRLYAMYAVDGVKAAASAVLSGARIAASWVAQQVAAAASAVAQAGAWALSTGTAMAGAVASFVVAAASTVAGWVSMAASATLNAIIVANEWALTASAAIKEAAMHPIASAQVVASWVTMAAQATFNAIKVAAAWVLSAGSAAVSAVASTATSVAAMVASWVVLGVQSAINGAKAAAAWLVSAVTSAPEAVATTAASVASMVASWVLLAVTSTANAVITAASWVLSAGVAAATAVAETAVAVASIVAGWILTAATAVASALAIAAAWLIAIAPLAIVTAAVIAIVVLIVKNWGTIQDATQALWDGIKSATSATWDFLKSLISGALSAIASFFMNWTAPGLIIKHWTDIKNATGDTWNWVQSKIQSVIDWFGGVPGKITSATSGMWDGLKDSFKNAIDTIIRWWNGLQFTLPSVDTHIPGVGTVGGFTLGTPDIPLLAKGGNFKGLAITGEKGPELVASGSTSHVFPNSQLMEALRGGSEPRVVNNNLTLTTTEKKKSLLEEFADMERLAVPTPNA